MAANDNLDVDPGTPIKTDAGGGYGNATATAGVPLTKLIPPVENCLSRLTMIDYEAAATAHSVTAMVPVDTTTPTIVSDVAINGTVFYISESVHDSTGNVPASGDWFAVRGSDGLMYHFQVASYATNALTITATSGYGDANGTGTPVVIPIGNRVWFFGSPTADHPKRRFYFKASTPRTLTATLAVTARTYEPIIVHSPNDTNAALAFQIAFDNPKV